MSFVGEVVSGVKWSGIGRYGEQAVTFLATAVLARLLAPEAFGVFGMAMLVVGPGLLVADLGTVSALIQRKAPAPDLAPSLFWVNLCAGFGVAAVVYLAAPACAGLFDEPRLLPVLRILAAGFVVGAVGAVPRALLTRAMAFDRLAKPQLAGVTTGGVVGVALAVNGAGVWSLIAQYLTRVVVETVGLVGISGFRPRRCLDLGAVRSVMSFGVNLSGSNVLGWIGQNVDNLLIGKFLGATALGYYDVAWRLIRYPVAAISQVVGAVLLPTLSRMQDEQERFGRAYLRVCAAIALCSFPLLTLMLVLAEPAVLVVLGRGWRPAAVLLMILAPVGMAQSIGTTTGNIYQATGRTDVMLKWGVFIAIVTTLGLTAGLAWGVVGIATARLLVNTGVSPVNFLVAFRLVGLRLRDLGRVLAPIATATALMAALVAAMRWILGAVGIDSSWVVAGVGGLAGVAFYTMTTLWLRPPILHEIISTLARGGVEWAEPLLVRTRSTKRWGTPT